MTTTAEKEVMVRPFTIEIDHPTNANVFVQGIALKLRSRVKHAKKIRKLNKQTGEVEERPASAKMLSTLPSEIPGQHLRVDPAKLEWEVTDSLVDDPDTCREIALAMRQDERSVYRNPVNIKGVPAKRGTLNEHQMKTLCRELFHILENGHAKVVKGIAPDIEDVNEMPGKYLTNAFSEHPIHQPQFEEDMPAWIDRLNRLG